VEQYIGDTGGESKKWVDVRLIYDDMGCFAVFAAKLQQKA